MGNLVEIKDLSKSYFNKRALDNLSLNIEEGRVVGILGPNGSGKTTMIKILTGLLRQSKGEVHIDGHKVGVETKAIVSYLPDRSFLYKWMTIEDALNFYSDFYSDFDEKRGEFKNWLGGITKFKCIDYKRRYLKDITYENIDDICLTDNSVDRKSTRLNSSH